MLRLCPCLTSNSTRVVVEATSCSNVFTTSMHALGASSVSLVSVAGLECSHFATIVAWAPPSASSKPLKSTTLLWRGFTMEMASAKPSAVVAMVAAISTSSFTWRAVPTASLKATSTLNDSGDSNSKGSNLSLTMRSAASAMPESHPRRTSTAICKPMSAINFLRLPVTCSRVSAERLILNSHSMTTTDPWMYVRNTSIPVSGGNNISCSKLYCDNHEMSAPRLTMPCRTWITRPIREPSPAAYPIATLCSRVVDMNAGSTPPLTSNAFACQN
mmetsp:Transcript_76481/g.151630  ORF Transcript_76481/g.151630 Transcript_76481/m.151630 type:complete len:273 (-) Transcript_76481:1238-2056(-)